MRSRYLDELDSLLLSLFKSLDHIGGVDLQRDKLIGSFQKFRCHNYNGGGSITDLFVLKLGQFNHDLGGRVLDLELFKDGGTY